MDSIVNHIGKLFWLLATQGSRLVESVSFLSCHWGTGGFANPKPECTAWSLVKAVKCLSPGLSMSCVSLQVDWTLDPDQRRIGLLNFPKCFFLFVCGIFSNPLVVLSAVVF